MDAQDRTYRREFLATTLRAGAGFALGWTTLIHPNRIQGATMIQPYPVLFKDDGVIPNSRYALLLYRHALDLEGEDPASRVQKQFASYNWTNSWMRTVFELAKLDLRLPNRVRDGKGEAHTGCLESHRHL